MMHLEKSAIRGIGVASSNFLLFKWGALAGVILLYFGLSSYQINLPGLHYDEAFEAVPALQLLSGQPVTPFRNAGVTVGGYTLPLMTQDYIGALNTFAALPLIDLLGPTPAALRSVSITLGGVTLLLTYLLAARLTGRRWVGLVAALLLSVDPTFVFWNRQGIFVTAITAPIGLGATYCWLRRLRGGSMRWSAAGAFLFGLGIYAKLLFVWLIAALVGAAILLNLAWLVKQRANLISRAKRHFPTEATVATIFFLLGCWPLLVYNWQTSGTVQNISQNASTSYYGVDNLAFGSNLVVRLAQFVVLLQGSHLWYLGDVLRNWWQVVVFGLVLMGVGYSIIRKATFFDPRAKIALFPFFVIGLVVVASVGTVSALWITHFAILMPWPALAIVGGSWYISSRLPALSPQWTKALIGSALGLLFVTNLLITVQYHTALSESGGLSSHSDAVYDLTEWLMKHAQGQVVAMDWGLAAPVIYLSGGQVKATEIFGYRWESDVQLSERLEGIIHQPNTLYLWRSPDEIIFDRSGEFKALYRPLKLEENIEEAFYERSGRPILGVTRLVDKGTAQNPPR